MGDIRLPGLATGIDTTTLVEQLMIIESRRLASYQVKKAEYEKQKTTFTELETKVNALKTTVTALSDSDNLQVFKTTTSDKDILTVSASSDANPGSHSIEINQLATSETWIQEASTFDYETDYVGGGTFIYSYNHQERVIMAVADETTLEDFVGLINNDADNPGVTASLLYHDGKYHLMLSGNETGTDYQISVNASNTQVLETGSAFTLKSDNSQNATLSTKITELDQFGSNPLEGGEVIEITGDDHDGGAITMEALPLTSYTTLSHLLAEIENAFDGNVKATLENGKIVVTDTTAGTSSLSVILNYKANGSLATLTLPTLAVDETLVVETEGGSVTADLTGFEPADFIETQSAQDSEIRVDGYPPQTGGIAEVQTLSKDPKATAGTLTLTYDGQTTGAIAFDAELDEVQDALELLSNVSPGDICVSGKKFKDAGDMTFTFRNNAGDVSMISIDMTNLTPSSGWTFSETIKGDSTNCWIRRNSNSIADALTGVTLNLHDVTETGTPIEITVQRSVQAISKKITNMLTAYNKLTSYLKEQTEYNKLTKKMGILSSNLGISFIKSQIRSPFFGIAGGFGDDTDSFLQASDIGLTVDHHGLMELDQSELDDALDENFMDVVYLLGAAGIGDSDSNTIDFYGCSKTHTTAGTYDVDITVSGGIVTRALIKLSSESTWRNAIWSGSGSLITGDSTFDDNGGPLYPENSLQLTVNLSTDDDFTATVRVKQGIAGALEETIQEVIEADGRLDVGVEFIEGRIDTLEKKIKDEEARLENREDRLVAKFARMERTLTTLQQQMSAVTILTQYSFGSMTG